MDYETLRLQHKQSLVERAFAVFEPSFEDPEAQKQEWVRRLLDGHGAQDLIASLKAGEPLSAPAEEEAAPPGDRAGKIELRGGDIALYAGVKTRIPVAIQNDSGAPFKTTPDHPLFASYHWYEASGGLYQLDGVRTALPEEIPPGSQAEVAVDVMPPATPGTYRLMITMVHEGVCWMEEAGLEAPILECAIHDYDGRGLSHHAQATFMRLLAGQEASG